MDLMPRIIWVSVSTRAHKDVGKMHSLMDKSPLQQPSLLFVALWRCAENSSHVYVVRLRSNKEGVCSFSVCVARAIKEHLVDSNGNMQNDDSDSRLQAMYFVNGEVAKVISKT